MTRFISVADCDFGFCECMEARDFENASSYYESLKHHYKKRGKQIKTLLNNKCKIIKEKDKQIQELQAEVERLSDLCFKKESELMDLKDLIPIKNKIKRVVK